MTVRKQKMTPEELKAALGKGFVHFGTIRPAPSKKSSEKPVKEGGDSGESEPLPGVTDPATADETSDTREARLAEVFSRVGELVLRQLRDSRETEEDGIRAEQLRRLRVRQLFKARPDQVKSSSERTAEEEASPKASDPLQSQFREVSEATFDLDFTPKTYWESAHLEGGASDDSGRQPQTAISSGHWWQYRDFLPKLLSREVEIARIALDSVTRDVISVRARPTTHGVAYRAVDEYSLTYSLRPKTSRRPLSMAQLIALIEGLNIDGQSSSPAALRSYQLQEDAECFERLRHWVTVSSEFYPSLSSWYKREAERWMNNHRSAT